MQGKDVAIMLVFLASLATAGWMFYLVAETRKRQLRVKAQTELHGRLLDKFGSAREVVEFLQTPGGVQFVDSFSSDREEPASGILRSTHRGIVLVIVAAGCLFLNWYYRNSMGDNPLLVIGVILLCLGIGFLISAAVSQRLSRTLGLAQRTGNTQP
jgi:type II secretory pathway component PulF